MQRQLLPLVMMGALWWRSGQALCRVETHRVRALRHSGPHKGQGRLNSPPPYRISSSQRRTGGNPGA